MMHIPFLSPSRCVLLMGDESLLVYDAAPGQTYLIDSVPWEAEEFEQSVADLISYGCKGKPVLILNDMVEQHYRKERIPHAGPLDRAAIVQRRLASVFQAHPIRAALRLKEDRGTLAAQQEAQGVSGAMYLFAGIPMTKALNKVIEAVQISLARVDGLCLLPPESAGMVRALSQKLTEKGERQAKWTLFIGQHHSGGLRQIVIRDGELALTRMIPIVDTDSNPESWSKEVISEFKSTMGYLSRFGYDSADGLDIIVVCGSAPTDLLEDTLRNEGRVHLLSSLDAGDLLGLHLGVQDDVRYADPLHVAWASKKHMFSLPLQHRKLLRISMPRSAARFTMLAMIGLIAFLGIRTILGVQDLSNLNQNLDLVTQQRAAITASLKQERGRESETGYSFSLVRNVLGAFDKIDKTRAKPLDLLEGIGRALDPQMRLKEIQISKGGVADLRSTSTRQPSQNTPEKVGVSALLTVSFSRGLLPEEAYGKVKLFHKALQKQFPLAQVTVTRHVADLGYEGKFSGVAGDGRTRASRRNLTAEITIEGARE